MITGTTKLLGVIGYPIAHSLSPVMHNSAIGHLGMDYVYLPLPVKPEKLAQAIEGFRAIDLQGFNVTIPHKQAIVPFLTEVSAIAQAVGAVNTVWWTGKHWAGTNTDVAGFVAPLKAGERAWNQSIAVVLGNGGAARAVVVGCQQLGFAEIHVVGRDRQKLHAFQKSWIEQSEQTTPVPSIHTWEALPQLLPQADLLVNTTPIGMHPHDRSSPLDATLTPYLSARITVYDLIYTPRPTQLLHQAQFHGAGAIDGLEMLIHQGAAALQLWLQHPAPIEVMRQSLLQYLP